MWGQEWAPHRVLGRDTARRGPGTALAECGSRKGGRARLANSRVSLQMLKARWAALAEAPEPRRASRPLPGRRPRLRRRPSREGPRPPGQSKLPWTGRCLRTAPWMTQVSAGSSWADLLPGWPSARASGDHPRGLAAPQARALPTAPRSWVRCGQFSLPHPPGLHSQ